MEPSQTSGEQISISLKEANQARISAESAEKRLHLVDALTTIILRHPEVSTLLKELTEHIPGILKVDNVAILRINAAGTELIMDTVRGPEEAVANQVHVPVGHGVAGRIFASRQPLIIEDLARVEVVNSFLSEHLCSLAGVPLLVEDRAIGVLHVATIHHHTFTDEDIQILQLVADRVALALDRARILANEKRLRAEAITLADKLRSIQMINDVALQHVQLDQLIDALLPRVRQLLRVDNVAILLPATDAELRLYSVFGPEQEVVDQVHVPIGAGVAGRIMATGIPLNIEDLSQSDAVNPFLREHMRSLLGVPLRIEERILGVLHISTVLSREFSADDLEMLQAVAGRIALAIDRAQAFDTAKRAQKEAEERAQQVAELNQRMDNFLSIASHELRTPLTSSLMNLQFLPRKLKRLLADSGSSEQMADFVLMLGGRIQRQLLRMNSLVSDLLDASRIQSGQLEIRPSLQDVRECVREIVEEQQTQFPEHDLRLTMPDFPIFATIDQDRVGQVVTNFLTNALKFAPAEKPIIITVTPDEHTVTVSVSDHGPGISAPDQARIWGRFQRVENISHVSGSQVGLGLGLYICRTIIDRHKGELGVTSQLGKGSTFWFRLPRQTAP